MWTGSNCESPSRRRCLISLSEGGEDAATMREFDLARGTFVPGGFVLPRGKQTVAWATEDALFVAREWEPGTLTESGYPFVVKRLERGKPLSSAVEEANGYGGTPIRVEGAAGHLRVTGAFRRDDPRALARTLAATFGLELVEQADGTLLLRAPRPARP